MELENMFMSMHKKFEILAYEGFSKSSWGIMLWKDYIHRFQCTKMNRTSNSIFYKHLKELNMLKHVRKITLIKTNYCSTIIAERNI